MQMMKWWLFATIVVGLGAGCSKPDEDPKAGEGEACTVDADCQSGLACRGDVCVKRSGTDTGLDAGGDASGDDDMGTGPVEDEDYFISYILQDAQDNTTLWVYDTATGQHTQVSPDGADCRLGCWLSDDLGTLITAQSNEAAFDVLTTPLNTSFETDGNATPIASGVRRIEVRGNIVTYVKEEGGSNNAYYQELGGGGETLVGTIGEANATEGDWHLDPESSAGVLYNATLQTLDVKIGELGDELQELTYTLNSENYQMTSGSYFGGSIPTAFSPDGKRMAFVTQKAPLDYNLCDDASECLGPGQRCGQFGRCAAIEVAVHFFDLDNLDNLGEACSADDTCGPVHTCDIPAEDAVDQAVCIPRRVVLGLPGDQMQNGQTGCALTEGNEDYHYTDIRSPISFGPDGDLYLTAARACGEFNIEDTDILRLSPESSDYSVVWGNDGVNFSPDDCYDPVEEAVDVTNCTVWIERAMISPGGNELAFIATNPNVVEPALAATNVDLWTVKRNGADHAWVGEHGELSVVEDVRVHPPRQ
jgi:hypothetical protein